jgi:hypothetical protein
LARGWPVATNLAAEELGIYEEIRRIGGDSRHGGSIPRPWRLRTARRTFSAPRRSKGRRITAALGGELGYWEVSQERGREQWGRKEERPGREKGAGSWRPGASSGGSSLARGSRRWHSHVQEASTQVLPVFQLRRQSPLFKKAPWLWGVS